MENLTVKIKEFRVKAFNNWLIKEHINNNMSDFELIKKTCEIVAKEDQETVFKILAISIVLDSAFNPNDRKTVTK